MKAKELEKSKPRNFVAKNAKMGGAGAHKDKKKAAKQGDVKHKSREMAEATDLVDTMIAEGRLLDYLPPFRAMGFSVDDRRGNSVLEANDQGVAKEIAALLNKAFPPRQATGISKESIEEARANTASARAGLSRRKAKAPLSKEEQAAKDKAKSDKWLEKERAKNMKNESLETRLAKKVNSFLIEGAGVSDSHKKLAGEYSDFHKDLHGMRPKHNEDEWHNEEFLQAQIDKLHATFDKMKATPEGRAALEADGWILDHAPQEDMDEAQYRRPGSPTAYDRDYRSSVSGMGHKDSLAYRMDGGANDEGEDDAPYQHKDDKPVLKGYYFYDVPPGKEGEAAIYGVKKTKSGKWAKAVYSTSGRSYALQKNGADKAFGPGKFWSPNK